MYIDVYRNFCSLVLIIKVKQGFLIIYDLFYDQKIRYMIRFLNSIKYFFFLYICVILVFLMEVFDLFLIKYWKFFFIWFSFFGVQLEKSFETVEFCSLWGGGVFCQRGFYRCRGVGLFVFGAGFIVQVFFRFIVFCFGGCIKD